MTTTDSWLPLAEYSMKHHVSISTLRRRIKADDISYRFDDGKYFILDEAPKKIATADEHRPSLSREAKKTSAEAVSSDALTSETGESVITAANKLLSDLKRAYTKILQEKEEQILSLREEVVDLNTLVKILETENARLHDREQ
jgi:hypothetical protein